MILLCLLFSSLLINLRWYLCLTPHPDDAPVRPTAMAHWLGSSVYALAVFLSVLRLLFAVLPYVWKLVLCLLFGFRYRPSQQYLPVEGLRVAGDMLNVWLTFAALRLLLDSPTLLQVALTAEVIRLVTEKGQMVISGFWQQLPHRFLAQQIPAHWQASLPALRRYCCYYMLPDDERMRYILRTLKQRASTDPDCAARLAYVSRFHIVPERHGLRGGHVRDVATGSIFIHRRWTNDPWLLIGQALRRSPWVFDPRYLRRPFRYRTESNRLSTLYVLCHARYSRPYAVYQFGHEIKAARYMLFFAAMYALGWDLEAPVGGDGAHEFDPLLRRIERHWNPLQFVPNRAPLWNDAQVISDLRQRLSRGESWTAADIAAAYTYPLRYVEDVLLDRLHAPCEAAASSIPPVRPRAILQAH